MKRRHAYAPCGRHLRRIEIYSAYIITSHTPYYELSHAFLVPSPILQILVPSGSTNHTCSLLSHSTSTSAAQHGLRVLPRGCSRCSPEPKTRTLVTMLATRTTQHFDDHNHATDYLENDGKLKYLALFQNTRFLCAALIGTSLARAPALRHPAPNDNEIRECVNDSETELGVLPPTLMTCQGYM